MPIIEGPDGAGKSTLAKSSAGALDTNISKMTADGASLGRSICRSSHATVSSSAA